MAAKIHNAWTGDTPHHGVQTLYMFHCPGCGHGHGFHVPHWKWNGSLEKPTFTPSLLCNQHDPASRCHSFVTDGKIRFLPDCFHKLAGQTVDLPDWETNG